ncbi:nuclear transport factor 2 family protein [Streptomyces sp. NPDC097610]|uniref:nuclear transport factor 2 family protein n=1 Tax=Streptomyces sp. NPDC097610 TaxID=3157227 RepID=UPI003324CDEB
MVTADLNPVEELLARERIRDTLARYSRGVDRCDAELLKSVYHPEALDLHGSVDGPASDYADYLLEKMMNGPVATHHLLGHSCIEFGSADSAHVETYFVARHLEEDSEGERVDSAGGRYCDDFALRDGAWKIQRRTVVVDWNLVSRGVMPFPGSDKFRRGVRSHDDPGYAQN